MDENSAISDYNEKLPEPYKPRALQILDLINRALPEAESKVWHGHPVWFIDGNPIAGYSLKKDGLEVLFWSGKSFQNPGLNPVGSFQAAGIIAHTDADLEKLGTWLGESKLIQWDYKNLPKKRTLEKLTNF